MILDDTDMEKYGIPAVYRGIFALLPPCSHFFLLPLFIHSFFISLHLSIPLNRNPCSGGDDIDFPSPDDGSDDPDVPLCEDSK